MSKLRVRRSARELFNAEDAKENAEDAKESIGIERIETTLSKTVTRSVNQNPQGRNRAGASRRLKSESLWTCEVCGRKFAKTNQAHSCRRRSIAVHFNGKDPRLRLIFEALIRTLEKMAPLRVDAVKSSINLISKYHFGAVAIRRDYLRIGFIADHEIRDPRIIRTERVGDRRIVHYVNMRSLHDVDKQLLGWLAEAQDLQAHR